MKKFILYSVLFAFLFSACEKNSDDKYIGIWELESVVVTNYDSFTGLELNETTTNPPVMLTLKDGYLFSGKLDTIGLPKSGTWYVQTQGKAAVLYFWNRVIENPPYEKRYNFKFTVTQKTSNKMQLTTYAVDDMAHLTKKTAYNFSYTGKPKKETIDPNKCNGFKITDKNGQSLCFKVQDLEIKPAGDLYNMTITFTTSSQPSFKVFRIVIMNDNPDDFKKSFPFSFFSGAGLLTNAVFVDDDDVFLATSGTGSLNVTSYNYDESSDTYTMVASLDKVVFSSTPPSLNENHLDNLQINFSFSK